MLNIKNKTASLKKRLFYFNFYCFFNKDFANDSEIFAAFLDFAIQFA